MSIFRSVHDRENPYFQMRRDTAQNRSLSFMARGALAYLLSKPDGWRCTLKDLMAEGDIGRDRAYGIMDELKDAGHLEQVEERDENGHFQYINNIYETPRPLPEKPHTANPVPGNPHTVEPLTVNQHHVNIEEESTDKEKIQRDKIQSAPPAQPANHPKPSKAKKPNPYFSQAEEVFEHWKAVMGHPNAKFGDEREKAISAMFKEGFTVDDLKSAVDGCKADPWYQGQNDRNKVYDSIVLICRNTEQVEKFMASAKPSQALTIAGQSLSKPRFDISQFSSKTRSNALAAEEFMRQWEQEAQNGIQ